MPTLAQHLSVSGQPPLADQPPSTLATASTAGAAPALTLSAQTVTNGKAIAAFVIGILACIGCLIPIVGFVLAVTGIIIGSLSMRSPRKIMAIIGIVFSSIGLLLSIGVFVYTYQQLLAQQQNPSGRQAALVGQRTIITPCYTTDLPSEMTVTQTPGNCTIQALNGNSGEQYAIKVLDVNQLTADNLKEAAKTDAQNVINAIPGANMQSEQVTTFSGSPAYTIAISASDGSAGTISYVYRNTHQGNLTIVLHTQTSGIGHDLKTIEKNWAWQ